MPQQPWEKYAQPEGPWTKYAAPATDNTAILEAQAKNYPTAAEQGGKPGSVAGSPLYQGIIGKLAQLGHVLADTAPGAETGMEATGIPALDLARNVMGSGVPSGAGVQYGGLAEGLAEGPIPTIAKKILEGVTSAEGLAQRAAANRAATALPSLPASTTIRAVLKEANNLTRPARASIEEALSRWLAKGSPVPITASGRAAAAAEEASRLRQVPPLPPEFEPWRSTPSEALNIQRPSTPQFVDNALGRMNTMRDLQEATADEAARSKSWEPAERTFAPSAPIPYPKPQSVESILAGPSPEVIELEKAEAARIFNKVAGVPAGRKGVSVSSATGQVTTNPGNAPLRALESEGVGPLSKVQAEAFATPTPELQVKVYGEQQLAGQALEKHLAESKAPIDIIASLPPETLALPKMQSAMQAVKAPAVVGELKKLSVSPVEAHALRSEIGKRINWNPAVVTDANEALKDAYFAIGDQIESSVKGVGPFNKRWQEAYLYAKALKHQLEMIAAGKGL